MHMAKAEFDEGPEVLERFKTMMTQVFQAPKSSTPFAKPKRATKKAGTRAVPKKRVQRRRFEDDAG
jgi:hypothetical protein